MISRAEIKSLIKNNENFLDMAVEIVLNDLKIKYMIGRAEIENLIKNNENFLDMAVEIVFNDLKPNTKLQELINETQMIYDTEGKIPAIRFVKQKAVEMGIATEVCLDVDEPVLYRGDSQEPFAGLAASKKFVEKYCE